MFIFSKAYNTCRKIPTMKVEYKAMQNWDDVFMKKQTRMVAFIKERLYKSEYVINIKKKYRIKILCN